MNAPIRILLVEDNISDAELAQHEITESISSCLFSRVDTPYTFLIALAEFAPDLIISDYYMPGFNGMEALQLTLQHTPHTPFIILTGSINEDTAVECLKAGAVDYVLKERRKRLGPAVVQALRLKQQRLEHQQAEIALITSEERFRTLVRTLPDPLIVADTHAKVTYASPLALQLFGYEPDTADLQTALIDWVNDADRQQALDDITQVVAGNTVTSREYALSKRDGTIMIGSVSASCLRDTQNQPIGIILVVRDITAQKQAEESRARLEEQFLQAQKMESVGRLAGGLAHDFNNLLTVITGYANVLQEKLVGSHDLLDDLDQIQRAGDRAAALIGQLLAFSRKQILAPTALDLNKLVSDMHKLLSRLLGETITLQLDLQHEIWPVTVDPNQIEQVIMNLAVNARDAMHNGGVLMIATHNISFDAAENELNAAVPVGAYVCMTVTDNGSGMDDATRERIFDPFFTTKGPGAGTGLGLATVYGIVKQSSGDITVQSELGKGTTFSIFLPASSEPVVEAAHVSQVVYTHRGSETVLVVEDQDMVRELVRSALQSRGYIVIEASRPYEALDIANHHKQPIDLLLTDLVMPEMGGIDLAQTLRQSRPELKVLFMSGYLDSAVENPELLGGEVAFLPKPFSLRALTSKVREVLDQAP